MRVKFRGAPAHLIRELPVQDIAGLRRNVDAFVARGGDYRSRIKRID